MPSKLLTVVETAEYLRCRPDSVYAFVANGKLKSKRVGRHIRITEAAIEDFLNG